jgi:hypothetical protein
MYVPLINKPDFSISIELPWVGAKLNVNGRVELAVKLANKNDPASIAASSRSLEN